MKKFFKIIFSIILTFFVALYLGIVFLLPQIVNSKLTINKLQSFILNKTGVETNISGLNLKISPKLFATLNVKSVDVKKENVLIVDVKNAAFNYKLLQNRLTLIGADNIFVDGNYLKQFKKEEKKKKETKFDFSNIPEIHIKQVIFKSDEVCVSAKNIDTNNNFIKLNAQISAPFLKQSLKLGDSGSFEIIENKLKANKFKIVLGNSNLYLDGVLIDKNKSSELYINGQNLPLSEIMQILLYFQKSKDPSKKFIENFKSFKGTIDVDLKVNNEGVWGKCIAKSIGAKAVWFDIPVFFKEAVFNFRGETIDSIAQGILGNEKVIHKLDVTNLLSPEVTVVGTMDTTITPKFKFVPNLTILDHINANLVYKIKSKKPDVYYNVDIPANSDLIYSSFYLGLRDYRRKIYGNTLKVDNNLFIREFRYSYLDSNKEKVVLSGDGLFIKNIDKKFPDKFIPQYINCHTNDYTPISVAGSFGEKVSGGEFKGDLNYDFNKNQVLGTFDVIKARFKAFRVDRAHVVAKNGVLNITTDGLYKGEKYKAQLSAKNNIYGDTLIYDMRLFLDKLVLHTTTDTSKRNKKPHPHEFQKKVKDFPLTINNWEIVINEIKRDKFVLNDVKLIGSLKNSIFDFKMKDLKFADGIIRADGVYDFAQDISKMTFVAKNIDSNKAAETTLNLKDQIEGIASAKVDIDAKKMFKFLDAHCVFEVKEGFLPKLGDKEFAIKNSKYKLSEIFNIDLSQKDLMKDDIKGTFDVHNTEINNINITTWHELSAMYLEGNYEMEKQLADLQLFWKYSKAAPKGVRVFGIPFSLVLKVVFRPENSREMYKSEISKIPEISSDEKHTSYYRVHLDGDINKGKINLVLKEIR